MDSSLGSAEPDRVDHTASTASIARRARGQDRYAGLAFGLALPMMLAGLFVPSLHLANLWVLEQDYSLWSAVLAFWRKGYFSLFALLFTFTVVFPTLKILGGLWLFYMARPERRALRRWVGPLAALSKWSMLDVFIVAVLILALEGSLLTAASLGPGIALFAGSVVLSGWAYGRLMHVLIRLVGEKV
jgi:paraquat-inducible protein A